MPGGRQSRGVETFFDGKTFDPANPSAYLDSLAIKAIGVNLAQRRYWPAESKPADGGEPSMSIPATETRRRSLPAR